MAIITVNAGSSSLRLALFRGDRNRLEKTASARHELRETAPEQLFQAFVEAHLREPPAAVVHRWVHGGADFHAPCRIDAQIEAKLAELATLAPLHIPPALQLLRASRACLDARTPQIAVFDTAFYHALPDVAAQYALPAGLVDRQRWRRYGFHGLAHQAMWLRWAELHPEQSGAGRVISLQLGSGCSITATLGGVPVDTSMGYTPMEGLVMATRCGDLDPGLVLHLQRRLELDPAALETQLNQHSGLLGLSGESADMRDLLISDSAAAAFAVEHYCYRARKYIGAYIAALGGVDSIVFGGGVGEHAATVRARILANMGWADIELDAGLNQAFVGREGRISASASPVSVWVLPVDEERLMATQGAALLAAH